MTATPLVDGGDNGLRSTWTAQLAAAWGIPEDIAAVALDIALQQEFGGAPWTLYPAEEHGQRLALTLAGVIDKAERRHVFAATLAPVVADLTSRGYTAEIAEAWTCEIALAGGTTLHRIATTAPAAAVHC